MRRIPKIVKMPEQRKIRMAEKCPACNSTDVTTDYATDEIVCLRCGLVIY